MTDIVAPMLSVATPGYPSAFCLYEDALGITVGLEDGSVSALIEAPGGDILEYGAGYHQMPMKGWYGHGIRWGTFPGQSARCTVQYMERIEVSELTFPDIPELNLGDRVDSPVTRPGKDLGTFQRRVFLWGGVDDRLDVTVNGRLERSISYGTSKTLDLTQRVRDGVNTIKLAAIDKNRGRCWNVGYKIGDARGWKYSEACANITCGANLPKEDRKMYTIEFHFNFER